MTEHSAAKNFSLIGALSRPPLQSQAPRPSRWIGRPGREPQIGSDAALSTEPVYVLGQRHEDNATLGPASAAARPNKAEQGRKPLIFCLDHQPNGGYNAERGCTHVAESLHAL